jgi:hypothetical protein
MKFNKQLFFRKAHRYLGIFIGIQFIGWTISGLYFSWNNIDDVHGDHMRKPGKFIASNMEVISPSVAVTNLKAAKQVDSVHSIQLINILNKPTYQIRFFSGHSGEGSHLHVHYALADAATGTVRKPLTEEEAKAIAIENVISSAKIINSEYLTNTNGHHEYREKPLPAYAISFDDPNCTVYISTELGTFQSIRHDQWRAFDFLWMLHTMDYQERDNFNNWLLKIFSVFGLITVCSGFILFYISSRTIKKVIS